MDVAVEDVTQIWGGGSRAEVVALDRFSHRFRSRRFSCLLGPSGCGKSTLIQIVGGLEAATAGTVRIEDPATPGGGGKTPLTQSAGALEAAPAGTVRIEDPATPGVARPLGADSVMVWQN